MHVGLLLRRICSSRFKRNLQLETGFLSGFFNRSGSASTITSASETFFPPERVLLKSFWMLSRLRQHLGQFIRIVDFPVLLRSQANAGPIGAAAHIRAAKAGSRCPGRSDKFRNSQSRFRISILSFAVSLRQSACDRPGEQGPAR